MPRPERFYSESGYYHVTTRGNGKQILFEEDADYLYYLHLLKRFCSDTNVFVCAYCLMDNHVHLLLYTGEVGQGEPSPLSQFMKKMGVAYSYYFNHKYERVGHLFQERFHSVPIESDERLLTVFRYILNNPRKAGICEASEYRWSSYRCYGNPNSFVDTKVLSELLGGFNEYEAYIAAKYEDDEPLVSEIQSNDARAKSVIRDVLGIESGIEIQAFDRQKRNEAIRKLKENGLSVRQISRLTGISKSVIQRVGQGEPSPVSHGVHLI